MVEDVRNGELFIVEVRRSPYPILENPAIPGVTKRVWGVVQVVFLGR